MAAETTSHEAVAADHGAHAPAGTTEVAAHGGGESGGGLPQFEFEHWGGQIVWLFLIFAVLYILLSLEAYSLLIGSLLLFAALAGVMYATRRIDWGARRERPAA